MLDRGLIIFIVNVFKNLLMSSSAQIRQSKVLTKHLLKIIASLTALHVMTATVTANINNALSDMKDLQKNRLEIETPAAVLKNAVEVVTKYKEVIDAHVDKKVKKLKEEVKILHAGKIRFYNRKSNTRR